MTNDDLKRFYNVNEKPERDKDFVRYGSNGEIITEHDATKDEEVVNYRTLIQHAGGGDKWYQHNITISPYSTQICILLKSNTLFTLNSLGEWLWTNNYKQTTPYTVNYPRIWDDTIAIGYGLYAPTSTNAYIRVAKIKVNSTISDNVITNTYSVAYDFIPVSPANIIDTVTEL